MDSKNFGKLISLLRREKFDETGESWTQKHLADASNLSLAIIQNVESGKKKHLESEDLAALATALQLTTLERREFFCAATDNPDNQAIKNHKTKPLEEFINLLAECDLPGYISDPYMDVLAVNALFINLLKLSPDLFSKSQQIMAGSNEMRFSFDTQMGYKNLLGDKWPIFAIESIRMFRYRTLRYRTTAYFQQLYRALCKYPQFKKYWLQTRELDEDQDMFADLIHITYKHNDFGQLSYFPMRNIAMTIWGELYLTVYSPTNRNTLRAFMHLAEHRGNVVYRLAQLPDKYITNGKIN